MMRMIWGFELRTSRNKKESKAEYGREQEAIKRSKKPSTGENK
jgi:hypothetical protein